MDRHGWVSTNPPNACFIFKLSVEFLTRAHISNRLKIAVVECMNYLELVSARKPDSNLHFGGRSQSQSEQLYKMKLKTLFRRDSAAELFLIRIKVK